MKKYNSNLFEQIVKSENLTSSEANLAPNSETCKCCKCCGDFTDKDYCVFCDYALADNNYYLPQTSQLELSNMYKESRRLKDLTKSNYCVSPIIPYKYGGFKYQKNMLVCPMKGKQKFIDDFVSKNPDRIIMLKKLFSDHIRKNKKEYDRQNILTSNIEMLKSKRLKNSPQIHHALMAARLAYKHAEELDVIHKDYDHELVVKYYLTRIELGDEYEVDHIYPLSLGGWHHQDNLQVILKSINREKSNLLDYHHPNIRHWTDLPHDMIPVLSDNSHS